jgi:hypothetical protein
MNILPILDCKFVADAFFAIRDTLCNTVTSAMKSIYGGNALQGIGMVAGSIIGIVAHHSIPT